MANNNEKTSDRVGLYIDLNEVRGDGSRSSWAEVKQMAQGAERAGFGFVALADRLQMRDVGVWESTTMVAAIAAVTERIRISTGVTRSIYRNPTLLAKVVDSLDEISGGRFRLGLGAGSDEGDNRAFGFPDDHRVSRFEEAIDMTHTLLRTGKLTHSGRYYSAENTVLQPRGPSKTGPPIMIAARGPRMMSIAAKYADYWNCMIIHTTPEPWQPHIDAMNAACEAQGRDPDTLKRVGHVLVTQVPGVAHHYGEALSGEPQEIADGIMRFLDYGFDEVIAYPSPNSSRAVEAMEPVIEAINS